MDNYTVLFLNAGKIMWVELNLQLNLNFINIDFGRWTKLFTPFLLFCVQVHLALPLSITFLLVRMTGLTSYVLLLTPQMEWGLCWEEWSGLVGSILSKYYHKYMALWFERTWLRYRIITVSVCPQNKDDCMYCFVSPNWIYRTGQYMYHTSHQWWSDYQWEHCYSGVCQHRT